MVEEKEEVNPDEISLSLVPIHPFRNWKLFSQLSYLPLRLLFPSFPIRNYFPFPSFLSIVLNTNYTMIVKGKDLAIRWKFDPSGIDFQFLDSSPSPQKTSHTMFQPVGLSCSHFSSSLGKEKPRKRQSSLIISISLHTSLMIEWKQIYKEYCRQRWEENRKQMEELNLGKLTQALKGLSFLYSSFSINGVKFYSNLLQDCHTFLCDFDSTIPPVFKRRSNFFEPFSLELCSWFMSFEDSHGVFMAINPQLLVETPILST